MLKLAVVAACLVVLPSAASAQETPGPGPVTAPVHAEPRFSPAPVNPLLLPVAAEVEGGMPAWLKWGLIGGVAAGGASALLSGYGSEIGGPSRGEAAVTGFAVGFVVIGGAVAVYQALCTPDGWSRRNGLCSR